MNGQLGRCRMVEMLFDTVAFRSVLETGTFRGTTTEYLARLSQGQVRSVEGVERNYHYSRLRLSKLEHVTVELSDSRDALRRWFEAGVNAPAFCYLDAHWEEDLPLQGEIDIIGSATDAAVVLIDDFQVPGDEGYGYDDYGPDRALTASILKGTAAEGWARFAPALPSAEETGARRGCVVLAGPAVEEEVARVSLLRRLRPSSA